MLLRTPGGGPQLDLAVCTSSFLSSHSTAVKISASLFKECFCDRNAKGNIKQIRDSGVSVHLRVMCCEQTQGRTSLLVFELGLQTSEEVWPSD